MMKQMSLRDTCRQVPEIEQCMYSWGRYLFGSKQPLVATWWSEQAPDIVHNLTRTRSWNFTIPGGCSCHHGNKVLESTQRGNRYLPQPPHRK
jgi:hypothetical protein